jgi:hypothetical protein
MTSAKAYRRPEQPTFAADTGSRAVARRTLPSPNPSLVQEADAGRGQRREFLQVGRLRERVAKKINPVSYGIKIAVAPVVPLATGRRERALVQ